MRIDDALKELIALQSMAKTPDQADDVDKLFMAGILTGGCANNLSKTNKTDLNKAMRNSSIPYAKLIELHDAPERLQALLSLATGNGPGDFSNFKYGKNGKNYNSQDFRAYVENQDKE